MKLIARTGKASIVKKTQGNWNSDERQKFFTAGDFGHMTSSDEWWKTTNRYNPQNSNLFAVNDFAEVNKPIRKDNTRWQQFMVSLEQGCSTFLDSGIFYLTNQHKRAHNVTMDEALALPPDRIDNFSWLLDVYLELCTDYGDQLWGYNELDQGGKDNKIETRAKLESLGLRPMPVYHPLNDGWEYFDELAANYDRMCYGNIVQASRPTRLRLLMTAYERHARYPNLYIHFLGLTPNDIQLGLPFDSADSSTWTAVFRYPQAVRLGGPAGRRWQLPMSWRLPLKANNEERKTTGDMSVMELQSMVTSIKHHHKRLSEILNLPTYPDGEDYE